MGVLKDLTGQVFGELTVIRKHGVDKFRHTIWECLCSCGRTSYPLGTSLQKGVTRSCGCKESLHELNPRPIKVPIAPLRTNEDRLKIVFNGMWQRCINPNSPNWDHYGARGIAICEEWSSLESFINWSLSNGHSQDLTLDRIDVSGPYSPEPCRWATPVEQANNRRNTVYFEVNKKKYTWEELSKVTTITRTVFFRRMREGWNVVEALYTPLYWSKKRNMKSPGF